MCMQFAYGLNSGGIQAVYEDITDARLWSVWAHKVSMLCQKERLKYIKKVSHEGMKMQFKQVCLIPTHFC